MYDKNICYNKQGESKKYVGKTEETLNRRLSCHFCDSRRRGGCHNRPLYKAFNKYGKENFEIELIEECKDNISCKREIFWIKKLNTYKNGYNATLGGDGRTYIDKEIVITNYLKYERFSKTAEVLGIDPNTVRRIVINSGIKTMSRKQLNRKYYGVSIEMYSKDGILQKSFESISEAEEYLGINGASAHISSVCKGKRKTAYGHIWKYQE